MATTDRDLTDAPLDPTPVQVWKMLMALSAIPELYEMMRAAGFTAEDAIEGRELLVAALAWPIEDALVERERLPWLVDVAMGPKRAARNPGPTADEAERRERLLALRLWYDEWAATALAVVRKRSYLIRMGLASARRGKKGGAG